MKYLFAILYVLLVGCRSTGGLAENKRVRVFDASYQEVFRASVAYCNERGMPVTVSDKDRGTIATGFRDCDGPELLLLGRGRSRMDLTLKEISSVKTRVAVKIYAEKSDGFGSWSAIIGGESDVSKLYQSVFNGIASQLRDSKGAVPLDLHPPGG